MKDQVRYTTLKKLLSERIYTTIARGNDEQNRKYCSKDNDFYENGEPTKSSDKGGSSNTGKKIKLIAQHLSEGKPAADLPDELIGSWARYRNACHSLATQTHRQNEGPLTKAKIKEMTFKPWQYILMRKLQTTPHDRKIYWYWDHKGGEGKTTFNKYLEWYHNAYSIEGGRDHSIMYNYMGQRIVIFDIRKVQEHRYALIETFKDGKIYSDRYEGKRLIVDPPHVIVFANTQPDLDKLSADRWRVIDMNNYETTEEWKRLKKFYKPNVKFSQFIKE